MQLVSGEPASNSWRGPGHSAVQLLPRGRCHPPNSPLPVFLVLAPATTPGVQAVDTSEPHPALLELGQIRFDDTDLNGVLLKVAELAKRTIPHTADVSVTLVRDQQAFTAAFTGADALELDESQYDAGYGPCLEVAQATGVIGIPDMAAEPLWPDFTRQAVARGLRCSLSIALPVQESVVGALNLYSRSINAFDQDSVDLGLTFASYAAVAIANAHLYETTAIHAANMRHAMETRSVIEQAKGIMIARLGCGPTEAFEALSKTSQDTNRKLSEIAAEVVAHAQKPAHGGSSSAGDATRPDL